MREAEAELANPRPPTPGQAKIWNESRKEWVPLPTRKDLLINHTARARTAISQLQYEMEADLDQKILYGRLDAYGCPDRADAAPRRIAPDVWALLRPDPAEPEKQVGGGCVYWNVRVAVPKRAAATQKAVEEWMLTAAQEARGQNRLLKRDQALTACRRAMGCTHLMAVAAWGKLPPELRRVRGKPKA